MKEQIASELSGAGCPGIKFFGETAMIENNKNKFKNCYQKEAMECTCGKRLYLTKKDALTAKNKREKCGSVRLRAYPCPSGKGWHLTHMYVIQPKPRKSAGMAKQLFKNYSDF